MVTWPLFADQFLNEKLVTHVLRIGMSLGVEVPLKWGEEEKLGVVLKKECSKEEICSVMDEGDQESKERRERASEFGEMEKRAVEKGGSSYLNIHLLQNVITWRPPPRHGTTTSHGGSPQVAEQNSTELQITVVDSV